MVDMMKDPEVIDNAATEKEREDRDDVSFSPRTELNWNKDLFYSNSPLVNIDRY